MELFGALRGRLCDSNKNLVMATLATIGGLASAMGSPVEKSSKVGKLLIQQTVSAILVQSRYWILLM